MKKYFIVLCFVGLGCATSSSDLVEVESNKRGKERSEKERISVSSPTRQQVAQIVIPYEKEQPRPLENPIEQPEKANHLSQNRLSWLDEAKTIWNSESFEEDKINSIHKIFDDHFFKKIQSTEEMLKQVREEWVTGAELFDFWLLEKLWEQKKYDEASRFAAQLMNSKIAIIQKKASYLFDQYYLVRRASPQSIGVLIPARSKQGQSLINSLKMAFGYYDEKSTPYRLIVLEEPEQEGDFEKVFDTFVKEENVIAIIGGLRNKFRHEIVRLSSQFQVPFIFMGQKSRVSEEGPFIFHYGLTLETQVRAIVHHGQQLGINRYAMIYPNDGFGVEAANLFWDEVKAVGAELVAAHTYHPQETDFQLITAKMSSKYDLESRKDEFKKIQEEKLEKEPQNKKKILAQTPGEVLPALYDYQALFIPDTPKGMAKITASLAYQGVRRIPVYGTRLWVNPEAFKLSGGLWSSYLFFPDSFYNVSRVFKFQHPFMDDFHRTYKTYPEHLEVSAFEIASILKSVLVEGVDTRMELSKALIESPSHLGLFGQPLGFDEYREIDAPMVMLRFDGEGKIVPASGSSIQ